uniref:MATH domain-containing protein n=1 Tax=Cacopsylla melanoneura TaxID=428564 RepID=A0A8D8ZSE0_9HEMI
MEWEKVTHGWLEAFRPNRIRSFHLVIKSMQTKKNGPIEGKHNVRLGTAVQNRGNNNATTSQQREIKLINNVTMTFQIQPPDWDTKYESEEKYLLGDLKWKICFQWTLDPTRIKTIYTMYLECIYDNNQKDWECTVECRLKWISNDSCFNNLIIPCKKSYTTLTLTGASSCVEIGKWELGDEKMTGFWWYAFEPNDIISTFHLVIKSMQTKMNCPIEEIHNVRLATTERHRGKNNANIEQYRVIYSCVKTFQIQGGVLDIMHDSEEEYLMGDLKWKICLKKTLDDTKTKHILTIYLVCTSDSNQNDWECTVELQLSCSFVSNGNFYYKVFPDGKTSTTLTLTRDNSCVQIGEFQWLDLPLVVPLIPFKENAFSTFHLVIKSIQTNMLK